MCRSTKTAPRATAASVVCESGLVPGVADRYVRELSLQGVHHPQVELADRRRVRAGGVAEHDVLAAEHLDGVPDLAHGRHAGGQDDRPPGVAGGCAAGCRRSDRPRPPCSAGRSNCSGSPPTRRPTETRTRRYPVLACSSIAAYSAYPNSTRSGSRGTPSAPRGVPLDVPFGRAACTPAVSASGTSPHRSRRRRRSRSRPVHSEVAVVVDTDLAGHVDRMSDADDRVAELPGGRRERPRRTVHDRDVRQATWRFGRRHLNTR